MSEDKPNLYKYMANVLCCLIGSVSEYLSLVINSEQQKKQRNLHQSQVRLISSLSVY
jgi:hypothetical protein